MSDNQNTQSGAVFYYILLAVALIAALTYFVSRDNRASVGILSNDQARIAANEIIDYGNTVAQTVQKLKLRGCSDTEISFENNIETGYANGSDTRCQVFNLSGGAINYTEPNDAWGGANEWRFTGRHPVQDVNTSDADLLVMLSNINQSICFDINKRFNIPLILDDAPEDSGVDADKFDGIYTNSTTLSDEAPALSSQTEVCFRDSDDNIYVYYKVLIAR